MSKPPDAPAQPSERRMTFAWLIVEDDATFAAMVTQVVREAGGQPTHCKTLAEARTATDNRAFDLVLLDNWA